jgi:hypothetical protein
VRHNLPDLVAVGSDAGVVDEPMFEQVLVLGQCLAP